MTVSEDRFIALNYDIVILPAEFHKGSLADTYVTDSVQNFE